MKQRFTLFIAALILSVCFPLTALAYNVEVDGIYYNFDVQEKTAKVIRGIYQYTGEITIPETITVDEEVYNVTGIGQYAFYNCASLTSITIPNSVTSIGEGAFSGCPSLSSISVDPNNTIYDSRDNCNAIIRTSDNALMAGCQSTIIPNSVTSIGDYAFYCCSSLTSVTIPNSVTSIGNRAFDYCSSLTSVTIPNTVTSIGNYAFSRCSSLTSITIPNSVTSIGEHAFYDCSSLTSVTIPNTVTSIGEWTFSYCSSLTSITIPNSVTNIGRLAFYWCKNLENVYCYAETVPSTETDAFYDSNVESATLYVPAPAIDAYKTTEPWSTFGTIVALDDDTGINSVPKRGIAIQTASGFITISGLDDNEKVDFYTLNGTVLGTARATNGVATFSAQSGSVLIARIGNESVKIIVE